MIFGDPDYNVGVKYGDKTYTKNFEEYINWYIELTKESTRVLKDNGNLFMMNYPKQNAHLRVKYLDNNYPWSMNMCGFITLMWAIHQNVLQPPIEAYCTFEKKKIINSIKTILLSRTKTQQIGGFYRTLKMDLKVECPMIGFISTLLKM